MLLPASPGDFFTDLSEPLATPDWLTTSCLEFIASPQHQHVVPPVDADSSSSESLLNARRPISVAAEASLHLCHVFLQLLVPHRYAATVVTPTLAMHPCPQACTRLIWCFLK